MLWICNLWTWGWAWEHGHLTGTDILCGWRVWIPASHTPACVDCRTSCIRGGLWVCSLTFRFMVSEPPKTFPFYTGICFWGLVGGHCAQPHGLRKWMTSIERNVLFFSTFLSKYIYNIKHMDTDKTWYLKSSVVPSCITLPWSYQWLTQMLFKNLPSFPSWSHNPLRSAYNRRTSS